MNKWISEWMNIIEEYSGQPLKWTILNENATLFSAMDEPMWHIVVAHSHCIVFVRLLSCSFIMNVHGLATSINLTFDSFGSIVFRIRCHGNSFCVCVCSLFVLYLTIIANTTNTTSHLTFLSQFYFSSGQTKQTERVRSTPPFVDRHRVQVFFIVYWFVTHKLSIEILWLSFWFLSAK